MSALKAVKVVKLLIDIFGDKLSICFLKGINILPNHYLD